MGRKKPSLHPPCSTHAPKKRTAWWMEGRFTLIWVKHRGRGGGWYPSISIIPDSRRASSQTAQDFVLRCSGAGSWMGSKLALQFGHVPLHQAAQAPTHSNSQQFLGASTTEPHSLQTACQIGSGGLGGNSTFPTIFSLFIILSQTQFGLLGFLFPRRLCNLLLQRIKPERPVWAAGRDHDLPVRDCVSGLLWASSAQADLLLSLIGPVSAFEQLRDVEDRPDAGLALVGWVDHREKWGKSSCPLALIHFSVSVR